VRINFLVVTVVVQQQQQQQQQHGEEWRMKIKDWEGLGS
jgi:hypothetical protein